MHRTIHAVLLALAAGTAVAQGAVSARPDPADVTNAAKPSPAAPYRSAFEDYRPYADPEPRRWRDANEEMGRLNGHVGHVPGSVPPRGASSTPASTSTAAPTSTPASTPAPPAHAGHGERK